jgi:hypothetical protein
MELVLQQKPRALVVLAHLFAIMKLVGEEMPWFVGVAEKHIPTINDRIPSGFKPIMRWPLDILNRSEGSTESIPDPPGSEHQL